MQKAIDSIIAERARQDAKWGTNQEHQSWPYRMSILAEEVGEAAREANDAHAAKTIMEYRECEDRLREELVHVAAVAVKTIELIDQRREF